MTVEMKEVPVLMDLGTKKPITNPSMFADVRLVLPFKLLVPLTALLEALVLIALFAVLLYTVPQDAVENTSYIVGAGIVVATAMVSRHKTLTSAVFAEFAALTIYPLAIAAILFKLVS